MRWTTGQQRAGQGANGHHGLGNGLSPGSQGGTVALLNQGVSEDELGLTRLREVAARRIQGTVPFWWTYRIRLAVR